MVRMAKRDCREVGGLLADPMGSGVRRFDSERLITDHTGETAHESQVFRISHRFTWPVTELGSDGVADFGIKHSAFSIRPSRGSPPLPELFQGQASFKH